MFDIQDNREQLTVRKTKEITLIKQTVITVYKL